MRRFAGFGLFGFALAALLAASAQAATQIARSIPIAPTAGAPDKVQQECQLQTLVPQAVQQAGADVQLVDGKPQGRWLELSISEVQAPGGGFFSGPKWIAVSGELHDRARSASRPPPRAPAARSRESRMPLARTSRAGSPLRR